MSDLPDLPDELAGEARRRTPPRLRQVLVLGGLAAVTAGAAGWAMPGDGGKPEPLILRDTLAGLTPADLLALLPDPVANT